MKPQAGAPVTGANFFNRDAELRLLEAKVRGGTHVLLAGQRRMGKTSLARELGRRLQAHDGHLERTDGGHRLAFRLLEDWLRTRFSDHHVPLQQRIDGPH